MAQAQGKSISELGTAAIYMSPDDLALISEKQTNGSFKSKAVKKEAFEKLTIAGDRDAEARSAASYKTISFLDNSSAHLGAGYIQQAFWAGGQNAISILARKKCGSTTVDGVLAMVVNPNGSRYGYCTAEGFGVGPQPTSASGANVYIQGSNGSVELRPPQTANHGGYIDFHYNGSTVNYTSRLIESSELQLVSTDKNVVVKTAGSGKSVILNAPANNSILQNAPTAADDAKTSKAIATVGWVASKFLPQSAFIDPSGDIQDATDMIEALAGLLNKQDLIIYVDSTSTLEASGSYVLKSIDSKNKGVFLTKDATKQTPVKSIQDAITIAKMIKFLENANCHIRILSDIVLAKGVEFSHPDLVQNKRFEVYGYDCGVNYNQSRHEVTGLSGSRTMRRISFEVKNFTLYYQSVISCRSQTYFNHLIFDGGLRLSDFRTPSNAFEYRGSKDSYFIRNFGSDSLQVQYSAIIGAEYGIVGPHLEINNTAFLFCYIAIQTLTGSGRSNINGGLNIAYCYGGIRNFLGSTLMTSASYGNNKLRICTSQIPFMNIDGSTATISFYSNLVDSALVRDAAGTIELDGVKYRRATSAEVGDSTTTLIVNPNMAGVELYKITGFASGDLALPTTDQLKCDDDNDSVQAFVDNFFSNQPGSYFNYSKGSAKWMQALTNASTGLLATKSILTVPGYGEIDVG